MHRMSRLIRPRCRLLLPLLLVAVLLPRRAKAGTPKLKEIDVGIGLNVDADVTVSDPIGPDFVSFSLEWSRASDVLSPPSFARVVNHLRRNDGNGSQGPVFRIGGNSADQTWWDPSGSRPTGDSCNASYSGEFCVKNRMTPETLEAAHAAAEAVNGSLVLDLIMLQNSSASWAVEEAKGIAESIGWDRIEAVEIGNEPDLFFENGARSPEYTVSAFAAEFDAYYAALRDVLPGDRFVQGGTFCCKGEFLNAQQTLIENQAKSENALKSWSLHRYPTSSCQGRVPTLAELMSNDATDGEAALVSEWVRSCKANGIDFVIGESNSCSCGGYKGLSDTLSAGLWGADFLFAMASVNVTRVNFHGGGSGPYTWLGEPKGPAGCGPDVRPLFYGMYAFAKATAAWSRLLKVVRVEHPSTTSSLVKVWATKSKDAVQVIVINKDYNATQPTKCSVTIESRKKLNGTAMLSELKVSNDSSDPFKAKNGIQFEGQTWDGSECGELQGSRNVTSLDRCADGTWSFEVIPGSLAVLSVTFEGYNKL